MTTTTIDNDALVFAGNDLRAFVPSNDEQAPGRAPMFKEVENLRNLASAAIEARQGIEKAATAEATIASQANMNRSAGRSI